MIGFDWLIKTGLANRSIANSCSLETLCFAGRMVRKRARSGGAPLTDSCEEVWPVHGVTSLIIFAINQLYD